MKSTINILTHQGLGDLLICNGLFRHFARIYDTVVVPVKTTNIESVTFMLRDCEPCSVRPILDDEDGKFFMNEVAHGDKLFLGCFGDNFKGQTFDQSFYAQANVPFPTRWDGFEFKRDPTIEIPVPVVPYVFYHEDRTRGFQMDPVTLIHYVEDPLNIGKFAPDPAISKNMFAYIPVLLGAKEIHCIDSSFAILVDSLPRIAGQKLFLHRYARKPTEVPTYRHDWTILQ